MDGLGVSRVRFGRGTAFSGWARREMIVLNDRDIYIQMTEILIAFAPIISQTE